MIIDKFKRVHNYLRISLIDKCNLRCVYCMPEDGNCFLPSHKLMSDEEIILFAKIFVNMGVNKIRLTGGEPLLRKNFGEILIELNKLNIKLCITTNGILLDKYFNQINQSNIDFINMSLDTLVEDKFLFLTKRKSFIETYNNMFLLLNNNIPLKLNVVVMKGINDNEIIDFINLTKDYDLHVRFIEFMPFDKNNWNYKKVLTYNEILEIVSKQIQFNKIINDKNDTAKTFKPLNHKGTFSIISTMSKPFCEGCNRMRITADGKLKNCLFSKTEVDLLTPLRKGEDITKIILECILQKEKERGGQINNDFEKTNVDNYKNRSMINIGG